VGSPVFGSGNLQTLTGGMQRSAFEEGFADWFPLAVAAADPADFQALGSLGTRLIADAKTSDFWSFGLHVGWLLNEPNQPRQPGRGEDDEASVARILWALTTDKQYGIAATTSTTPTLQAQLALVSALRRQVRGGGPASAITTLQGLWSALLGANPTLATMDKFGSLFQSDGVSTITGAPVGAPNGQPAFAFQVPLLNNDGRDPNDLLAFNTVTIAFYSRTDTAAELGALSVNLNATNLPAGGHLWSYQAAAGALDEKFVYAPPPATLALIGQNCVNAGSNTVYWTVGGAWGLLDPVPYWGQHSTAAPSVPAGKPVSATEGEATPSNTVVATISGVADADGAANFTATITWPDYSQSEGTIAETDVPGPYSVSAPGSHTLSGSIGVESPTGTPP